MLTCFNFDYANIKFNFNYPRLMKLTCASSKQPVSCWYLDRSRLAKLDLTFSVVEPLIGLKGISDLVNAFGLQ